MEKYPFCSVFNHLLDDMPLSANGGGKPGINCEVEKGLLTLISSDSPGLQVPSFFFYFVAAAFLLFLIGNKVDAIFDA